MVTRKIRGMWQRERSRRFVVWTSAAVMLLSGLPIILGIGPASFVAMIPLLVCAVMMSLVGTRHRLWLAAFAIVAILLPLVFVDSEIRPELLRSGLFSAIGVLAIAWANRQQRQRLQRRARARRRLVGRVKNRAKELKRTGSELRQAVERSEVAQRTLLEHLPVHVLQKDLAGRFTFASQSFCKLLNREMKDVLGRTDYDFYHRPIADKFREDDQRVTRHGTIVDDVERTELPDGSIAYMQVRKAPLRDSQGNIIGVQGIFWDVTEARRGKKELERIESWARALIQAALDAVLIVDVSGQVLETNPAVGTILGYQRQPEDRYPLLSEIMRTAESEIALTDSGTFGLLTNNDLAASERFENSQFASGGPTRESLNRLLEQATGKRIELRLQRHDDSWFDAEISAHPLVVENSTGWAIFVRDITRRKRSVRELQDAKEAAERANSAKSEFVANVSHELRTPLTGIVGLHELLERSNLDEQQREYVGLARSSSHTLLSLIDALLDFSKIEAHRLELESEPFDLVECIESAAISLAARAQLRGLELVIDCDPQLPSLVIGDAQRVRQVILNLVSNAIKFTPRGEIRLRAIWEKPTLVRFEVIDTGIGISDENQAVIFEAFRQADSSTTRRYGGSGLGLAISRELINLMGGSISVRSKLNEGSTFAFSLAFKLPRPSDDPPRQIETRKFSALNGTKVVVVAKPAFWRDVLQRDLESIGCDVQLNTFQQLLAREPSSLFLAGNRTTIIVDYRQLLSFQPVILPVVSRIVLTMPMAIARPAQTPDWLKHADFAWLPRPAPRSELVRILTAAFNSPNIESLQNSPHTKSAAQAKILLVEDSPINQTVLRGMMEQLGHCVTLACNGEEAVRMCNASEFDAVLMDIQMPEVDGLEATRRIREWECQYDRRPAHIIALTAHAMPSDREQARAVGMNGFLVKPISIEVLRQAIAAVQAKANPWIGVAVNAPDTIFPSDSSVKDIRPNWEEIEKILGGNAQLAREVVDLMRFESVRLFELLCDNCAMRNVREARRAAHTLKSNLRNLALNDVAALAGKIEKMVLDEEWNLLDEQLKRLDAEIEAVVKWCKAMLE